MSDVTKLPKWAQSMITRLERQVFELKHLRSEKLLGSKSRVEVNHYHGEGDQPEMYLSDGDRISFIIGEDRFHDRIDAFLVEDIDGPKLCVMSIASMMFVHPRSGNVVHIGAKD